MKYKITFEFRNERGDWVPDYLDDCGDGFYEADALDITRQLKYYGRRNVQLVEMPEAEATIEDMRINPGEYRRVNEHHNIRVEEISDEEAWWRHDRLD